MKVASKIAIVTAAVVTAVSIGTVCATWTFSSGTKADSAVGIDIDLEVFGWTGSEALSSGDGSNHAELIMTIITELNNEDSTLNKNLDERFKGNFWWGQYDDYGSMDPQQESLTDSLLGGNTDLSFIVEADVTRTYNFLGLVSGYTVNAYYIYTTDVYLGESGESDCYTTFLGAEYYYNTSKGNPTVPISEYIYCIYKTTLAYNDDTSAWEATSTEAGKAQSSWYNEDRTYTPQATEIPSFDTSTWLATESNPIGDSINNGIWTFDGDNPTVYADSADEKWYYKLATTGAYTMTYTIAEGYENRAGYSDNTYTDHDYSWNQAGTYNITTTALNATITVYDGSGSTVVTGTRYTPDITTVTLGDGSTVKTQTTTDTIKYSDGTYTVTTYTITTTTAADGTVSSAMTGRILEYDSADDQYPDDTAIFNDTGEISDLTIAFYANTASYYYIEVTGATEIPLTITNTTATE